MSKYKTGDKVVMEITKGKTLLGTDYYLFNDGFGIRQGLVELNAEPLTTYTEQARAEGHSEAWELARKIAVIPKDGGYGGSKLIEIFNTALNDEIFNLTYSEAAAKVEAWEKAKEEIKVGDEVEKNDLRDVRFIVTFTNGRLMNGVTQSGLVFANEKPKEWHKTGRHIDIDSFLKQIGEEQE